jgi:WD40 repeat protein
VSSRGGGDDKYNNKHKMAAARLSTSSQLASSGDDGIRVWRSDGSAAPHTPASTAPVASVRWFPSGKLLAVATRAGGLAFYLHDTFALLSELSPPHASDASAIAALDVSTGSRFLATGSDDGTLAVWDMKTRAIEISFREQAPIAAVSFQRTADCRYVACASGSSVSLYSRGSGRLVNRFTVHQSSSVSNSIPPTVIAMAFSPFRINILVAADDTGCVTVWDISRAKPIHPSPSTASPPERMDMTRTAAAPTVPPVYARFETVGHVPATDIAFCPLQGNHFSFCVAGLDKTLRFFNLETRRLVHTIHASQPLTAVAFAPNASTIAAGTSTGSIFTFDLVDTGTGLAHSLASEIHGAASSSPDIPASTPAIRSLHYQPKPSSTAFPPPRVLSAGARSAASPSASAHESHSLRAASSGSLSHASLRPVTRAGTAIAASVQPEMPPPPLSMRSMSLPRPSAALLSSSSTEPSRPQTPNLGATPVARGGAPRDSDIFSPLVAKTKPRSFVSGAKTRDTFPYVADGLMQPPERPSILGKPSAPLGTVTSPSREADIAPSHVSAVLPSAATAITSPLDCDVVVSCAADSCLSNDFDEIDGTEMASHLALKESNAATVAVGLSTAKQPMLDDTTADGEVASSRDDVSAASDLSASGFGDIRHESESVETVDGGQDTGRESSCSVGCATSSAPLKRSSTGQGSKSASEVGNRQAARLPLHVHRSRSSSDANDAFRMTETDSQSKSHSAAPCVTPRSDPPRTDFDTVHEVDSSSLQRGRSFYASVDSEAAKQPNAAPTEGSESSSLWKEVMRRVVAEEMVAAVDVLRADLRSDVLNLHRELVHSFSRQEEEIRAQLSGRDSRVAELELQVKQLKFENKRLRSEPGKKFVSASSVPSWM